MKKISTLFLFFVFIIINAESKRIEFIVKPYIQNVSTNGITILWETNIPSNGIVQYGKAKTNSNEVFFDKNKSSNSPSILHTINLTDLQAETKYFYKVISYMNTDTLEYNIIPFMTSINSNRSVTFSVFGDTQQQSDTTVWNKISEMALLERPNFGLIVGDLVDTGGDSSQWRNEFLANGHKFMQSIPLFPVVGNHDLIYDAEAKTFNKYMKHPGNNNYYTVKNGNVQLFVLDSNQDMEPGSPQYLWLVDELAKSKSMWKIAAHHHPPYSSDFDDYGNTESALPIDGDPNFDPIIPLYEKYNVDMVFYGHIHSYERTWPLANKRVSKAGVVYVQCGGAGGDIEHSGIIRSWFSAKLNSEHHFCVVSINNSKLYLNAIDYNGNLFDQYVIDKSELHSDESQIDGKLLSAPVIKFANDKFIEKLDVSIISYNDKGEIRYTIDGTEPTRNSFLYNGPFEVNGSLTIKVVVLGKENKSKVSEQKVTKIEAKIAENISLKNEGLRYKYYVGENWQYLPKFEELEIVKEGEVKNISVQKIKDREDQFAIVFDGYIEIKKDGVYNFYLLSDDGSKLFIADELVVDNNGSHSPRTRSGNIGLRKGYHKFHLEYFEDCEGEELKLFYKSGDFTKKLIPDNVFMH
ncbi:MAG: metallophosphoesterase [Bacteroidetes bacterium]|nr:metallophosphoesterase [Bacteroidota bacterium]MBU1113599.1 metallophosphoesterase [Bacteroidota bacterium]MBU1796975.1 metallophosphoesterase [Bacteroidota bacterium]